MQSGIRIYRYSAIRTAIGYVLMTLAGALLAGGIVLVKSLNEIGAIGSSSWALYAIFGFAFLGCVLIAKLNYDGSRPIAITANEISALSWNGRWRSINWIDVSRIEKVRFYDPLYSQMRSSFIFFMSGKKIRFSDAIVGVRDLLLEANIHIREHHIQVYSRDSTRHSGAPAVVQVKELDL